MYFISITKCKHNGLITIRDMEKEDIPIKYLGFSEKWVLRDFREINHLKGKHLTILRFEIE